MSRENLQPNFVPLLSQIEAQHLSGHELRNCRERAKDLIDIHYLCVRLINRTIDYGLEPFASCQGHLNTEKLSSQDRYNAMRCLVYNPETKETLHEFALHRKNPEKPSNGYLGIKMNHPLAKKLHLEIKSRDEELSLRTSVLLHPLLNLEILYIYCSPDSDWLEMEQTINQLLEKIKLEDKLVELRTKITTAA